MLGAGKQERARGVGGIPWLDWLDWLDLSLISGWAAKRKAFLRLRS
ncbi:MAG TPA: hypothetical protein VKQ36_01780 [Ktedonobacterales bacterium]|nr:hypothetical protein [Ktedonobacterales bacterium]